MDRTIERAHCRLEAWKAAINVVKLVYKLTKQFPDEERYGLVSQMRRCAVSIPSNIAEGAGRGSTREFIRFLCIARGSICELETQFFLSKELGYLSSLKEASSSSNRVFQLVCGLIRSLEKNVDKC